MIVHVWKMYAGLVPKLISFYRKEARNGVKAAYPRLRHEAQESYKSLREASFCMRAAQLFNRMPANVRESADILALKIELGKFLNTILDFPPVRGYSSPKDNSLVALLPEA